MNIVHGKYKTPENNAWRSMLNRCCNPNSQRWEYWGGRGISVCPAWREDFTVFLADMGERPSEKHSLDRIDNDGNYTPENCRWATAKAQRANQRGIKCSGRKLLRTSRTGITGVHFTENNTWAVRMGIARKSVHIGTYSTLLDAACARKSAELHYDKLRGRNHA